MGEITLRGKMAFIIALLLLGLILISVEFFIPGGIVGIVGVLMLLGAVGFCYNEYGIMAAGWLLVGCMVGGGLWAYAMFVIVSKTPYGRKLFLSSASDGRARYGSAGEADEAQAEQLIGAQAVALTPMSPTGRIVVDGNTYEASSQSGFLEAGTKVEIVGRTSFGFAVRKS